MIGRDQKFDVENAILMHGTSFFTLPAYALYDGQLPQEFVNAAKNCHIYMIGFVREIDIVSISNVEESVIFKMEVAGTEYDVDIAIPTGHRLSSDGGAFFFENDLGERFVPSSDYIMYRLSLICEEVYFDVRYIGQSYGKDGSRNALDRLLKHETLQKIAVRGAPPGHRIQLVLIEIDGAGDIITKFNPHAKDKEGGEKRIQDGLNKIFARDVAETTTLYEAALIRYFEPEFNIRFKGSFPSTNMKVLSDCYEKDFSGLVAEANFDGFPFFWKSEKRPASRFVIAKYNLHDAADRDFFFSR